MGLSYFLLLFVVFSQSQRVQYAALTEISCNLSPVELVVKVARVNIAGQVSFTTRVYHLNGSPVLPGPTIRTKAGQPCNVTITNSLTGPSCMSSANQPDCAESTNLHFHGSYLSPDKDAVYIPIQPGSSNTFDYTTPSFHLMGTHWYHPHFHGSTALQVMGGMHGAFIVDPSDSYVLPTDLKALYDNAYIMVLSFFFFSSSDTYTGSFVMSDYQDINSQTSDNYVDPNIVITGQDTFYTVNGQYQPYVPIVAGVAKLFRFVHTSGVRIAELELVDPSNWCSIVLIARDGVFQYIPYQTIEAVVLPQSSRADVAITCNSAGAGQSVDVRLYPSPQRDQLLGRVNRFSQSILFTLTIGASTGQVVPVPTSQAPMPDYLSSLLDSSVTSSNVCPRNSWVFGFGLKESANGAQYGTINGNSWPGWNAPVSERYADTFCLNKVYQMDVNVPSTGSYGVANNATGAHPVHIHTHSFQLVEGDGTSNGVIYRRGEWRDVISVASNNTISIRVKPTTFLGEMVVHCHIYSHSDRGMSGLINVVDSCPTPTPCSSPSPAPPVTTPITPTLPPNLSSSILPPLFALCGLLLFQLFNFL